MNPASKKEGRNERRSRQRERERICEFLWRMRVQWHRAPGSSVRSSPAARPRRFSRPFRESRGTLADRDSLLVPLCLPIARQSAAHYVENREPIRISSTPRLIRVCAEETCVISPVDLMVRERC